MSEPLPEYLGESGPVERQKRTVKPSGQPVLSVRDLHVTFPTDDGDLTAVAGLSYDLYPNEVLAIVGESGSGKSVSSMALLGLLPKSARVSGEITFDGRNLVGLKERDLLKLRGSKIAMVFQDALASLNPVFTVGDQVVEAITAHEPGLDHGVARRRGMELLD